MEITRAVVLFGFVSVIAVKYPVRALQTSAPAKLNPVATTEWKNGAHRLVHMDRLERASTEFGKQCGRAVKVPVARKTKVTVAKASLFAMGGKILAYLQNGRINLDTEMI